MPEQPVIWIGAVTVVADAPLVSMAALVQGTAAGSDVDNPFTGQVGAIVSLYFTPTDNNLNLSPDSSGEAGWVLQTGTPFTDNGTGMTGNVVPLSQIWVGCETTNCTVTVYLRALP